MPKKYNGVKVLKIRKGATLRENLPGIQEAVYSRGSGQILQ
jgi:hypothetical protein